MSTLRCTIIQTQLSWEDKPKNLEMLGKKIRALDHTAQLVLLPEMFSTGFSMKPGELAEDMNGTGVQWMRAMAAEKKIILAGSLIIADGGQFYNRMIWMQPDGRFGFYDKRHLFAYAGEDKFYAAGKERLVASVNGWKVNLMVCYDLRFPVWARQQASAAKQPEYDVLVYVANWPEKRITAWKTLLRARAIENQCYVIGVNRTGTDGNEIYYSGDSMVIDPLGEILYHRSDEEDVFTIALEKEHLENIRQRFPFWRDADEFSIRV